MNLLPTRTGHLQSIILPSIKDLPNADSTAQHQKHPICQIPISSEQSKYWEAVHDGAYSFPNS